MPKITGVNKTFPGTRIIIEKVTPEIDCGKFPIKRVAGENVVVRADVFANGHDEVAATLLYRKRGEAKWREVPMQSLGNDAWIGSFLIGDENDHLYSVRGYVDEFSSWLHDLKKKADAGVDIAVDLKIGSALVSETAGRCKKGVSEKLKKWARKLASPKNIKEGLALAFSRELAEAMGSNLDQEKSETYAKELMVSVERGRALFSSWYELFPRSWSPKPGKHGTFKDCERVLPEIARMGFDVLYLPPIHPIGTSFRKGKNNSVKCGPGDPGSPWAIGSKEGGHKAVNPQLGTLKDFRALVGKAKEYKLEIALDIALQCSPDHPYLKEHPDWFRWRPDGSIQYAENPPKKYEDIVPLNFDTADREGLWEEMKSVFAFWIEQGVRIFRVDNPHTKPFVFWDWLIAEIKKDHPDVLFLSEAFTRPKVMYRLAKGGFSQSYTYFTWRNSKQEFQDYLTELSKAPIAEFFRPNFWPNTPDILAGHLQYAGREAFAIRAVMAATLSSNYGIYGPAFELCVNTPIKGREEYLDSEKYEIKRWDWDSPGNIKDLLASLNAIRKENPCLRMTRNIRFCNIDNDQLLAYYKATGDYSNIIIVVVNLDPAHVQSGWLQVPIWELGIEKEGSYVAHDLLTGQKHAWQGERNYIELDPQKSCAHVIRVNSQLRHEQDFDYFL
ncbi:MAG: alpha-1,4-glucan--maltose-1-phosphate maltosyltransferase [Candidatus Omnitrophica bacterium]|nr:alpha-1,4-glucan--maltose-1-phosphate maltosyltransferase [Candidatus Omnitrophota bacterium]